MPEALTPEISVVVPIYNERETVREMVRRLVAVMDREVGHFEAIFVNDGSRDESLAILVELAATEPRLKVIDFSRNFGHQMALYAGMRRASGRAVILMDGDLQDPPEVLPRLIAKWREGSQVVFAVRQKRKEGLLMRTAYAAYYRLLQSVAYVRMPLDSGDFSLMDRRVVDLLCAMPERNKFLRGLRSWVGFTQTSVEYERDARHAGETKYTMSKLIKLALDGLVSYSYLPLRFASSVGVVVALTSFLLAAVYLGQRLFSDQFVPQGFTTLAILVLFLGGLQLIALGLLGEYIGRIYDEVKRRPEYLERTVYNFGSGPRARPEGIVEGFAASEPSTL